MADAGWWEGRTDLSPYEMFRLLALRYRMAMRRWRERSDLRQAVESEIKWAHRKVRAHD